MANTEAQFEMLRELNIEHVEIVGSSGGPQRVKTKNYISFIVIDYKILNYCGGGFSI